MRQSREIERSIITTYRKCIWRKFVKGINAYKMINEGDKIAVCISGGKDSMLMAKCMQEIHSHGVVKFDLEFITADSGFSDAEKQSIIDNAELLNIPLHLFKGESTAAALYEEAERLGCNKIALGHHFDDVIEKILYNMLYGGEIKTLMPREKNIIRPLYMVKEKDIVAWTRHNELEFTEQAEENSDIKELIRTFRRTSPYIDMNIFNSVQNINLTTVIGYHNGDREYNFLDDYDERGN